MIKRVSAIIKQNSTKAFTLIQLAVVIAILAVLAAIAIPHFMTANTVAKEKTCYSNRVKIARAYAIFEVKGGDVSLGDFLKGVATEDGEYMQYFKSPPICPSGGTYSASNGKIICSITAHNVDEVSLGEGRDYSNSIGGNILQSFVDFAELNPELSGSDLVEAWFEEYDISDQLIGTVDKDLIRYDGSTDSTNNLEVSIYLADGADASEAIVYIGNNASSSNPTAKFIYDPENDTWYKYKLTGVSSDKSENISAGSITFSLSGLTYTTLKEMIDTDTAFASDTAYYSSTDTRKSTALWAAESTTVSEDSPAMSLDFADNMDFWLDYN
jgi:competence protein ComGC